MKFEQTLTALLTQLQKELIIHNLWSETEPTEITSTVPFAADIMPFEQWLQFIFIPKMLWLIEHAQPLPTSMQITPMAEVTYGDKYLSVNDVLKQIDQLCTEPQEFEQ